MSNKDRVEEHICQYNFMRVFTLHANDKRVTTEFVSLFCGGAARAEGIVLLANKLSRHRFKQRRTWSWMKTIEQLLSLLVVCSGCVIEMGSR